jgi:hypothetical protein
MLVAEPLYGLESQEGAPRTLTDEGGNVNCSNFRGADLRGAVFTDTAV